MSIKTNNPEALGWKYDYVGGISTSDGVVVGWPNSLPTLTQDLVDAVEAEWEAKEAYKGKRQKEYPSIADQLDDIYHNGIDEWKKTIKVTKDKYAKG